MKEILTVYVCGPYSNRIQEYREANVSKAIRYAEMIAAMGLVPFVPHLYHYWNVEFEHEHLYWMCQDLVWLLKCDAVLNYAPSPGANEEVAVAIKNNIPVFCTLDELKAAAIK